MLRDRFWPEKDAEHEGSEQVKELRPYRLAHALPFALAGTAVPVALIANFNTRSEHHGGHPEWLGPVVTFGLVGLVVGLLVAWRCYPSSIIRMSDHEISGPISRWPLHWFVGGIPRAKIALAHIDRERSRRRTLADRLLCRRVVHSCEGKRIRISLWLYPRSQVKGFLEWLMVY